MVKEALIIVDVQNDFLKGGALGIEEGDQIIPFINDLMKDFSLVVATKDWHPSNHSSFATSHHKKSGETIEISGYLQTLWPIHCVQNSYGSEFPSSLDQRDIKKIFYKGLDVDVDSYSAFFDNLKLRSTGLHEYLKEQGVEEVFIVGLVTDYCVKYTACDARDLGYTTFVITDCCRGANLQKGDVDKAIEEMRSYGAILITSCEVSSLIN